MTNPNTYLCALAWFCVLNALPLWIMFTVDFVQAANKWSGAKSLAPERQKQRDKEIGVSFAGQWFCGFVTLLSIAAAFYFGG